MTFKGHFIRWQYDLIKPVRDHSGENSGRKEERHRGSLCRLGEYVCHDEQGDGRGVDTDGHSGDSLGGPVARTLCSRLCRSDRGGRELDPAGFSRQRRPRVPSYEAALQIINRYSLQKAALVKSEVQMRSTSLETGGETWRGGRDPVLTPEAGSSHTQ